MKDYRDREALIRAAEEAYQQQQQNREAEFTAFLGAHRGMQPSNANDLARSILSSDVQELSDEHLELSILWKMGIPPGVKLTDAQFDFAMDERIRRLQS
jgi:hypothetical protein